MIRFFPVIGEGGFFNAVLSGSRVPGPAGPCVRRQGVLLLRGVHKGLPDASAGYSEDSARRLIYLVNGQAGNCLFSRLPG